MVRSRGRPAVRGGSVAFSRADPVRADMSDTDDGVDEAAERE
jgi:hypothetical protein